MTPLPRAFFEDDPVPVARALLGATLVVSQPAGILRARIVETEAYRGKEDLACHAAKGRTARTDPMFGPPGHAYVYLIYGMYELLNVVTWPEGRPAAVLIRAVEPPSTLALRTDGPGKLTRALGIGRALNRQDLCAVDSPLSLWPGESVPDAHLGVGPRIGVDYAGEWATRPWRFWDARSKWVSRR